MGWSKATTSHGARKSWPNFWKRVSRFFGWRASSQLVGPALLRAYLRPCSFCFQRHRFVGQPFNLGRGGCIGREQAAVFSAAAPDQCAGCRDCPRQGRGSHSDRSAEICARGVPSEFNLLLNPLHKTIRKLVTVEEIAVGWDSRLLAR